MSNRRPLPPPEENVQPENYLEVFTNREATSKYVNPCEAASKASLECMARNDYDRDKCMEYFRAYRDCKKIWLDQRKADRNAGRPSATWGH